MRLAGVGSVEIVVEIGDYEIKARLRNSCQKNILRLRERCNAMIYRQLLNSFGWPSLLMVLKLLWRMNYSICTGLQQDVHYQLLRA